jgi:hypothetical protein
MTVDCRRFPAEHVLHPFTTSVLAACCCFAGGMFTVFAAGTAQDRVSSCDRDELDCIGKPLHIFTDTGPEKTRGVRVLNPGEDMAPIAPARPEPLVGPNGVPIAAIRVAVADGQSDKLDGMIARDAPFEIVAPAANPDLVWDPGSHTASMGQTIVAYKVEQNELPAVIDRTAAVRVLKDLSASKPQIMHVNTAGEPRHRGDKVEIDVENVANRALVLFNIAGDGTVQALYPLGSDPRVPDMKTYRLTVQIREPFGTDAIVAVTANQPMEQLEAGLRQISHFRSAGQALRLMTAAAAPDARIGLVTVSSAP